MNDTRSCKLSICIVEDEGYRNFYPMTKTRPAFSLRCGRYTLEERVLSVLAHRVECIHYLMRPDLHGVWNLHNSAGTDFNFSMPEGKKSLFINSRILFDEASLNELIELADQKKSFVWMAGDQWVAMYMHSRKPWFSAEELLTGKVDVSGFKNKYYRDNPIITWPWDLIKYNGTMIEKDFSLIRKMLRRRRHPTLSRNIAVLNHENLIIGKQPEILTFVTFDATEGPVIIGKNVRVEAGACIKGPVSIGDNCLITANAKIYGNTTIGDCCEIGGEITDSIIHGYSNKKHEGFLGHSYLGEWVNIGAGTNNSNLQNNYNTIMAMVNGVEVDTFSQYVGLYMGDHSRSAIGTRFNTATFVGVGCNIFTSNLTRKHIEDFTWGGGEQSDVYDFKKFIANAQRMLALRNVELSREEFVLLSKLYQNKLISRSKSAAVTGTAESASMKLYPMKKTGVNYINNPKS